MQNQTNKYFDEETIEELSMTQRMNFILCLIDSISCFFPTRFLY